MEIEQFIDIAIATNGSDYDVAKCIYEIYKNNYKFIDNTWYEFDKENNTWINLKSKVNIKIRNDLSEEVCKKFIERAQYYNSKLYSATDEGQKQIYDKKASSAIKIAFKLKQSEFKDKIIKKSKYLFMKNPI